MFVVVAGDSPRPQKHTTHTTAQSAGEYSEPALAAELHPDRFVIERRHMVESQLRARGIRDQRLLSAMASIPRHEFVETRYRDQAYEDHPIPIDAGQTISQPYIVALMLELLQLDPSSKVLEIGTGSGYQAAVLGKLARHVYTVERHPELARQAAEILSRLGLTNVTVLTGDGSVGLAEQAPFDAIVVAAATAQIPPALFEQLREGGRMIIPVGPPEAQELQLVHKQDGKALITMREGCRFVPLISG
jgi:protein-L-isoaspartate(D-aspartate) O-methyltransferase